MIAQRFSAGYAGLKSRAPRGRQTHLTPPSSTWDKIIALRFSPVPLLIRNTAVNVTTPARITREFNASPANNHPNNTAIMGFT